MKHIITVIAVLMVTSVALAEEVDAKFYVGLQASEWKSSNNYESAGSAVVGVEVNKRVAFEFEQDKVHDMDQYTARIIGTLFAAGNSDVTYQFGYTHGEYQNAGDTLRDDYYSYGLGYQYRVTDSVRIRLMHNWYNVGKFAVTDDLGRPEESYIGVLIGF